MATISSTSYLGTPGQATSGTAPTVVAKSSSVSYVQSAVSLAADSSVVSLLGGAAAVPDAAGLYNSIVNAGAAAQQQVTASPVGSLEQGILSAITDPSSATQALDALAATVDTSSVDVNANYASILKSNPAAAYGFIATSFTQGILATISTYA